MKSFMDELKETLDEDFNISVTENGAVGYRTSGKELLDLNFSVSSLRNRSDLEILKAFSKAYYENSLLAIKWLFYAGDVRGGLGERRLFRVCLSWLADNYSDVALKILEFVPEYTRWDNYLALFGSRLEINVLKIFKEQLTKDMENKRAKKPISLLAKWLPSINASSKKTRENAKRIIKYFGISERRYRKMLANLRSYLDVTEVKMSAKKWDKIDYPSVPSRANLIYNNAFLRNDEARRREYLASLEKGETKINACTLFPHDIVHKYHQSVWWGSTYRTSTDTTLEQLWKGLPDYVKGNGNTICVSDGSGSMCSTVGGTNISCLDVAIALSIYFSERSSGQFKDKFITFSEHPKLVDLTSCKSLIKKINKVASCFEVANTNIEAVFNLILQTAINNNLRQEDLPTNILILSDMEFDGCARDNKGFPLTSGSGTRLFKAISERYARHGYKLPRLVFWNICSRTNTIPVRENCLGVALVSGFSPAIAKMVLSNKTDPFECLLEQINSERYAPIERVIKS